MKKHSKLLFGSGSNGNHYDDGSITMFRNRQSEYDHQGYAEYRSWLQ
jgi:hypothetical protein